MTLETARCEEIAKKTDVKHALCRTSIYEQVQFIFSSC